VPYKRRRNMGLSEKPREYLENRRKAFETERYLPKDAQKSHNFLLRGHSFTEYVSGNKIKKYYCS
jgi:hypothetical protein